MATYGSAAAVERLLQSADADTLTTDELARVNELLPVVSAVIEKKTGAVFGSNTPETVLVSAEPGNVLFLPKGIRTITSIAEGPTWNGTAWTGGTALATTSYYVRALASSGAYRQIVRTDGGWFGDYAITGVWEDRFATVPDDITYAANYAAAEIYKKQKAAPGRFASAAGVTVLFRPDPFADKEIVEIIDRWHVGPASWVAG
jgi:hypothetical protein